MKTIPTCLLALLSSTAALADDGPADCPVLNGLYSFSSEGATTTFNLGTKREKGQTYYSFNGSGPDADFRPADGVLRHLPFGNSMVSTQVSCGSGSLTAHAQPDGQGSVDVQLTELTNGQLRAVVQGQTLLLTKN